MEHHGYKFYNWLSPDTPSVITIFSAPKYANSNTNLGALIKLNNRQITIRQYDKKQEPYYMLDKDRQVKYVNMFEFSLPIISENLLKIVVNIYKHLQGQEDEHISESKYARVFQEVRGD